MDIGEIRIATKKMLREQTPSQSACEEALPLCEQLWDAFPKTQWLWDAHQYANCLRRLNRLDEAERVCESVYSDFKDKELPPEQARAFAYMKILYAWVVNDKYIKTVRQANYPYAAVVLDKVLLLHALIKDSAGGVPSFPFCVLTVLGQLARTSAAVDSEKALRVLDCLDPALLSADAYQYTDSTGKTRENASQKEIYYKLKSDALLGAKRYEECIVCCNEAMEALNRFHYSNDVWFARKIAIALQALGNTDEAIKKLEKLVAVSDKWFLLYEIGKLYYKQNRPELALAYMLRAACTKDPEKMKVSLIESLGDLFHARKEEELAQDNYLFARQIRVKNGWTVLDRLNRKIVADREVTFVRLRDAWIRKLYLLMGYKQGKVTRLFPNKAGGLIQADKSYLFRGKNFFGKSDFLKVGDEVAFIVVPSYDKKRGVETEEGIVVMPCKKGK
ncbi:MAG: tetratricopeptide repeat protein [Clostridiales bacterium]|nr:tetratricopeptide repeat protein [Clostridiales bacterium]